MQYYDLEIPEFVMNPFFGDHGHDKELSKSSTLIIFLLPLGVVMIGLLIVILICWIKVINERRHRININMQISQITHITTRDVREIEIFESSTYNNEDERYNTNDCSICLDEFTNNDLVCKLSCNHLYHVSCINEWFKNKIVCPLCLHDYTYVIQEYHV